MPEAAWSNGKSPGEAVDVTRIEHDNVVAEVGDNARRIERLETEVGLRGRRIERMEAEIQRLVKEISELRKLLQTTEQ